MGVGEQLDLHGVEPNALPPAAGTLHALVKVRIILSARERCEQSDLDRQGHHERRCAVDGERRAPVEVVKARDDDIEHSAALDLPGAIRSGARPVQKQQMQQSYHEHRTIGGKMFDVGQQLLAIPGVVPDMLKRIRRWNDLTTFHILQAATADRTSDPPTVAPAFQDDRRPVVAAMPPLAYRTYLCRFASSDHRREAIL